MQGQLIEITTLCNGFWLTFWLLKEQEQKSMFFNNCNYKIGTVYDINNMIECDKPFEGKLLIK